MRLLESLAKEAGRPWPGNVDAKNSKTYICFTFSDIVGGNLRGVHCRRFAARPNEFCGTNRPAVSGKESPPSGRNPAGTGTTWNEFPESVRHEHDHSVPRAKRLPPAG